MNTVSSDLYFRFETDFVEDEIRCIPMVVRFKLDAVGIKLKLKEWSKLDIYERENLAVLPCATIDQVNEYKQYLQEVIFRYTGEKGTDIPVMENPSWSNTQELPYPLLEKLKEFDWNIPADKWKRLTNLQRFALLKLSYGGHENENFPKAMKEFNLVD